MHEGKKSVRCSDGRQNFKFEDALNFIVNETKHDWLWILKIAREKKKDNQPAIIKEIYVTNSKY